jgi:deoxyribonuclease V
MEPNWNLSPAEAVAQQRELAPLVVREDRLGEVRRVAGIDVGFEAGGSVTRAAVAVLDFPSLALVEQALARRPTTFPYVPGLLSFREAPAVLEALAQLAAPPDLILYDGQGLAHPRRIGIASHVGLLSRIPTIGVAKTRLVGEFEEPGTERGAWSPLFHRGEEIGAVLRTRTGVAPLYVSTGWGVSLPTAIRWVLACAPKFRLPETTRQAHRLASGPG